jgi:hypothetical protein
LILLRILLQLAKDPNKSIQTAVALTPEGQALMGAKALTGK